MLTLRDTVKVRNRTESDIARLGTVSGTRVEVCFLTSLTSALDKNKWFYISHNSFEICGKKSIFHLLGIKLRFSECPNRSLINLSTEYKNLARTYVTGAGIHIYRFTLYTPLPRLWQIIRVSRKLNRQTVLAPLQTVVSVSTKTIL
jgi:hypothetical protein